MKVLFKKIEKCKECPYFKIERNIYGEFVFHCEVKKLNIEYENSIPKWCPLPDEEYLYEEKEEE